MLVENESGQMVEVLVEDSELISAEAADQQPGTVDESMKSTEPVDSATPITSQAAEANLHAKENRPAPSESSLQTNIQRISLDTLKFKEFPTFIPPRNHSISIVPLYSTDSLPFFALLTDLAGDEVVAMHAFQNSMLEGGALDHALDLARQAFETVSSRSNAIQVLGELRAEFAASVAFLKVSTQFIYFIRVAAVVGAVLILRC
jgi:hypothetical protein